ncbi:hypothetical protein GCM10027589_14410 [Actinocorallia lasiicapitis]
MTDMSGKINEFEGKAKETVGKATGDAETEGEGMAEQLKGQAQELGEKAKKGASEVSEKAKKGASDAAEKIKGMFKS